MKLVFFLIGGGLMFAILSGAAIFGSAPAVLVYGLSALAGLLVASVV